MALFVNSNPLQNDEEIKYGNNDTGVLNEFAKGFGSGVDQLQALGGGAKALAGSALGIDSWFEDGMDYFNEQMAEANENAADVGSLEDIDGIGDFANYSAFIVGNIIPSLIGGGGVGAVGGAAAKKIAINQGAKALVKKNAEGMAKSAASRQYAQSAVGREALGKAGLKGQMAGATAFGTTMGAGESFTRIFDETGEEAAGLALVTGLASGALDAMTPMRVLKRVLPQNLYGKATQEIAENVSKKQSVIGRAFKEAAKASGTEGVTEMMQEVVQSSALEFVRGQSDPRIEEAFIDRLFDEENRSQYLNAFVAGAIGGGAIGGVTGAVTKDPELKQNLDDDALKGEPTEGSPEVAQEQEQDQDQNETIEDQPQPESTDGGGERVQAARAKALGLPTGRTTIAPKSRDQVREEVDGLPEQREATDPEAMQVEARAKVRAQIDGLPAVREKIKEIYQMELGTLGETTRIPKDKEPEPVAEEPPVFGGNLPESITPRMEELVGKDVDYNGNKGPVLKKDDGFYVATQDNGDVLIESGEYQSPEQLGVVPTGGDLVFEKDVQIDGNNKFELRGKKYTLTRIIRDADGNPLSLAVRDDKGAKRNIRTPEVVSRISNQKNPAPDFRQIIVELDDLPASIQRQVVQQSDPENIPDSVPASQAIEIAQSLPNSESMISDIQEMATQSLTISASAEAVFPPVKYTESVNRPSIKPLAQAIADVNKAQGSNRSPIDEGRINSLFDAGTLTLDDGTRLPSVMQNDGKDGSAKSDEIKSALVDLLGAGMPKRVLKHFKGLYVHPPSQGKREADGAYLPRQQAISLNKARISELAADTDDSTSAAALMRFNLAHEIGHAFDLGEGHTLNSPDFSIDVDGMTPSGVTFDLGPVLHELGQNFQDGTELGLELGYPFGYAYEWLSTTTPDKIEKKVSLIQKEAFAQAFAVFHASPEMLQEQAPLTYKHLENLLRTQPTETIQDGEADIRSSETEQQSQEVQGQVRSPAESRSPEVQVQDGAGGAGGSGIDAEQASQGLGEQTQREDGDSAGRPVQLEQTEPKVKRAEDFENTGNYNVAYPDGTEYLIYRDTMQFADPMWHLSPEYYDILELDSNAIERIGGIGGNRKEALQWLNKAHRDRAGNAGPDQAGDLASFDDDALFTPFNRVPSAQEDAPILPMGKVEQALADLLQDDKNPTPEQLGKIVGAPKKRKGKEDVQDVDVRPVTLDELRGYVKESLEESDNLKWYDEFGGFFRDLVGDANLDEASVIFGVTSAQNAAENNLAETLHIMALARRFNPETNRKQFELAVKETPRTAGQRLMVTGQQIEKIADLYAKGSFDGGIKTTTYMQMVQDRGRNEYNPFSVQDVHMSRVFGFRKKDYDKKSGALVDAAKISSENEYRYAQYLTSVLADEFGMSPNQMQATLWFYAKQNLSPLKEKGGGRAGTLESARDYSKDEIDVIQGMVDDGSFDKSSPLTEALSSGVRPRNKPVQKTTPFSNVEEREQLLDVVRARSPRIIASAVAGKDRGLAFPDDTPIETLIKYNQDVMQAITDDGGQIPILREMGIPHEIEEAAGSFTGYEPAMTIRFLGSDLDTVNKFAPLLGDALLQDAVITSQMVYKEDGLPTFAITKLDASEFSREESMALTETLNPEKDPNGINFNQKLPNTLIFLDPRSLDDSVIYEKSMAKDFFGTLQAQLGDSYQIDIGSSKGNYYGSDQYQGVIRGTWNKDVASGSPTIYDRTRDSLYEPVRQVYNRYAKELGIPQREIQGLADDQLNAPPRQKASKPNAKGNPAVQSAYQRLRDGEIDRQEYDNTVLSSISPYDFVPQPATQDEMYGALNSRKREKINTPIADGENVGLRLDIPAYTDHGVWVPTIHGKATSHRATAYITGADFTRTPQGKAEKVMEGGAKSPFAQIRGGFVNRTDEQNAQLAESAINDPAWTQVGFDPRRHSYFYDRKTGQPILNADEVIQVGPLVLAKNATSGMSDDFLYSPTRTPIEIMSDDDLIASVRTGTTSGGESGIPSSGIKKWLQKNFSSRGLLPETAFDSMIQRDGEFGAVELDIRQMVGIYDNAVVENFGNIDGQQRAVLDDAMKRPAAEIEKTSLPRNIKDSLIAMRGYIDSLSTQYAQVLNNDIETLKAQGNDEATAKSELLSIVVNNMGTYANRSYQAFNNKDWNKEVPEEVVLAARNLLVEQGTVNPDQVINTILKEGTAYDDMASFISESKLGAKDLAILTKRKQIAPEIRALLGEYKDPRVNFANSASKMSRLIYNDRFLKEVLASGNGVFLFDQESAPADATKKIAEVGSKTLSPLNGMYTYPEVEQAFKDALGKEEMGDLYRTIIKVNGLVKYGKTVIAPTTMARNFMSASLFTVANGHFNWSKLSKSAEVSGSYFSGIGDGIEYLKNLKKLGVVHDSPYAGEMIAYLQDANAEGILDQRDPSAILDTKDAALSLGKRVAQGFTKAYQFGDDFWKIVGFENEVMSFMENKGMSREEAEPLAAKRIRDTYPTYSLIGKIPQQLRRFPLVGTFVSFPAEIVRTQANMIKYLREDLADPDMRPAALKRITGMAMMSAGVYAAQAMAMSAFGVSEEEEEAIKLMAAPWAKNSNILVTGRDDEGRLEYLDLTHLDPYALMKRPLNALMRDQPIDDALIDASAEILKPFLGWDISTNTILEFISNEKSSGGEVYNDADTFINKSIATYMHFERGMGPSVLQNARRIEKAMGGEVSKSGKAYDMGDEMGALVGFRKTTFDPKTALHFKAYEFSEGKRQSTKLLTSVFRDPNDVSDSDIREAFGRASTARKETFNDMAALVNAAMASGLNATQAMAVLRSNGVTKKDARALIDGGASAWTMSDSTLKNSIVKSDILFGQQKSQEFKDRWTLIQQLLKEES